MNMRKWSVGSMTALSWLIIVWRQIMREIWVDHYQMYSVRISAALFLATSFAAMLTEANVSSLVRDPRGELTTMTLYWGYALAPGMLVLAASFARIMAKRLLAPALLVLCLLCVYFVWLAHLEVSGWVWVGYWPLSMVSLLFMVVAPPIQRWFKKVLR
jgi:hypothetical protein